MANTLANPTVQVNNTTIGIVPNSATFKRGLGDINIRPQSAGGNSIQVVKTENAETKKSMVKFSLYNTEDNIGLVKGWQNEADGVLITMSEGTLTVQFRQMYIITDPEINLGADGNIEVEFEGLPSA